ncbi:type VI toxin-antitoxin system SocA family antitoxin [Thalassospira lucentensis]|uniref:type VI toxin-antitoxin system SocA family antitoxin n=1 Tax=Thalassospira lucentensis TaxID=168935 RepID=UPI003D2F34FE
MISKITYLGKRSVSSYDPRSVANLLLDQAETFGVQVTNLALQKLLYFAHGAFLIREKKPLVSGYFEAWTYGPVHPAVYKSFKSAGSSPIEFRAEGKNIVTGGRYALTLPDDNAVNSVISAITKSYGQLSPGMLVDISHAPNSPWDIVKNKSRTDVAFGLRIPDTLISANFRHHKVRVGTEPNVGEPLEDKPIAGYRPSTNCPTYFR